MAALKLPTLFFLVLSVNSTRSYSDNSKEPGYEELHQKYTMVVNEVEGMRETIKTMKTEMNKIKRISRALDALCEELHSSENGPELKKLKEPTPDETIDEDEILTPINVISLKTMNDTFELEYQATSKAEIQLVETKQIYDKSKIKSMFAKGKGLINGSTSFGEYTVQLDLGEYTSYVFISGSNNTEITLPPMVLSANVPKEVVFEPGKSSKIKVKVSKGKVDHYNMHLTYGMFIISRNETEKVVRISDEFPGIINKTVVKEYLDYDEHPFIINANKEDYEGMLELALNGNSDQSSTVPFISLSLILNVRRSDHLKPFPKGFLGFYDPFGDIYEYNMPNCEVQSVCDLYCVIFGYDPDDISLWKMNDDSGDKIALNVPKRKFRKQNIVTVLFKIDNISKQDAGTYMCRGTSVSGKVIEKEVEISVSVPYTILQERSEVIKDTPDELVVKCVGRGYPDPEIRFYKSQYYSGSYEITVGPGISIETTMESDEVTTAILTLDANKRYINQIFCLVRQNGSQYPYSDFKVYEKTVDV